MILQKVAVHCLQALGQEGYSHKKLINEVFEAYINMAVEVVYHERGAYTFHAGAKLSRVHFELLIAANAGLSSLGFDPVEPKN